MACHAASGGRVQLTTAPTVEKVLASRDFKRLCH
jgi:hypothetical protein